MVGAIAMLIPGGAGVAVLLDPLSRKSKAAGWIRITSLDALPTDGTPRRFPVIADKFDAWSKFPQTSIGSVYLQRSGSQVTAFNTHCPHAGCFVDAIPNGGFHCPCHGSKFAADGSVTEGASPRPLDKLEVDDRALKGGIVQVRYQNFEAGTPRKNPRT